MSAISAQAIAETPSAGSDDPLTLAHAASALEECTCPHDCPRDHDNE